VRYVPELQVTDEMVKEFRRRALADGEGIAEGLSAVLAIVEQQLRKQIAADIRAMPHELGDEGWNDLERRAEEAGYDRQTVRRRRRGDFTTTTIEAAYQYGYRRSAQVARGLTGSGGEDR
jgi:hypothetical protein